MSAPTPTLYDRVIDGRYQVEAELARGGMATVYRARDLRLDRPVALKVMRPDLADDDSFVRRFVAEARAAARLSHPHVVGVFDQGEDGDVVFLAMELVEGPTLRDVITDHAPLSTRRAMALLLPVTEALAEAHRHGLVHRDIKPENVLLAGGRESGVKVADFGLARAVSASGQRASTEMLWGTAAYLAPEQVEHGAIDARADVYAVGLLLFELLTGRKAFPGGDPLRVAYEHVHGAVPRAGDLVDSVPAAVDDLISRAAATDPADRPRDASALLVHLRAVVRDLSDEELDRVPSPPRTAPESGDGAGDLTQVVGADAGSTRQLPVQTARGEGHYARTTGNRKGRPPAAAPPTKPRERRRRRGGVVLTLLFLLLLGGGGYAAWWLLEGPGVHSPMPQVVDLPEEDARSSLDAEQLDPVISYAYSEDVASGTVISAEQQPGTQLRHGTDVPLVVSQGPERYAVPPLAGLTLESAQEALAGANLVLGEQSREHHESEPEGRILRISPEAGEPLPPGATVDVVISDGPAPVEVPEVTGQPEEAAVTALRDAGLSVTVAPEPVFDDEVPEGAVVSQSPSAGSVERGSTVTITLSQGPELVTVPQVVGRQFSAAEEELSELGLVVTREDVRGGFFGTVREQSVEPGEEVPTGTEIVLAVV
ncbi:Serine/threonine protein kinase PrkC, regulator of stationary phase [Serinicoccus hydrothermalis]|uniref:non-specific serine/threonine protein kinase n=1 Tax=Serinicoccus hydrothermalis TaxID=1758689 RepID=A0A1B1N9T8_9MICO|nr:Stk1 family PASTA domain-containing Ser/Thr kinase [Serinicoccus hydrothermalis]ANS78203.1 Serine/threonine protein kinase PrkC, regulator of stationary phase [Serinicoccus hydrothermalis]